MLQVAVEGEIKYYLKRDYYERREEAEGVNLTFNFVFPLLLVF